MQQEKKLSIKIPAGVDSGARLRLQGEGEGGLRGGPPGDLYIFIDVQRDEFFERKGSDVYCNVNISITQAALGAQIDVPGLESTQQLKIPKGTQTDEVFRLEGVGVPFLRGYGKGDQYVRVVVQTPTDLSDEEEHLLRQFADLRDEHVSAKKKGFLNSLFQN